jgi:hypothetical protein
MAARRSGSDKRRRTARVQFRVDMDELAALEKAASEARLTLGSYSRKILLGAPPARARRKASPDAIALARLLGELGKVGSNINQIAYFYNAGRRGDVEREELHAALHAVQDLRDEIMRALKPEGAA